MIMIYEWNLQEISCAFFYRYSVHRLENFLKQLWNLLTFIKDNLSEYFFLTSDLWIMNPKNKLYMIIYFSSMFTIPIQYNGFCILCLFKLNTIRLSEWYTKLFPPPIGISFCDNPMWQKDELCILCYRQSLQASSVAWWPLYIFIYSSQSYWLFIFIYYLLMRFHVRYCCWV